MSSRKPGVAIGISSAGTRPRKAATGSLVMPARKCSFLQRLVCDLRSPLREGEPEVQGLKPNLSGLERGQAKGEGKGRTGAQRRL